MKPKHIKKVLMSEINKVANNPKDYCFHPDTDFTRKRKISMKAVLTGIIGMGSGSLTNELIDFFHASPQMPTPSAFLQQRSKIKPEAFRSIFDGFNETITKGFSEKMPIFAVDGSDIQIATNPGDTGSYYPGSNGQKGYNLLHLNALYEIDYHIYADSIIQKSKNCNEHKALQEMVDRSTIPEALIIADRGYESYNSMAHIQEKGWKFLIRIKDGACGIASRLTLPNTDQFDVPFHLKLTNKQTNEKLYIWGSNFYCCLLFMHFTQSKRMCCRGRGERVRGRLFLCYDRDIG